MSKSILILLLCISMCCIFLLAQGAADKDDVSYKLKQTPTTDIMQKLPLSMINYVDLILDLQIIQHKRYITTILAQIYQANVWDDFKTIIEQMNLAESQDVDQHERENIRKKLRKQKLSYHATNREINSYYAKKYIKQQLENPNNRSEKKYALNLIQHIEDIFSINNELLETMDEAEKHEFDIKSYITQQQRQVAQAEKTVEIQLSKFNIKLTLTTHINLPTAQAPYAYCD